METPKALFAKAMFVLGETYNEPVSETRVRAYWDALVDLPLSHVIPALKQAIRAFKFFPKPSELRELTIQHSRANKKAAPLLEGPRVDPKEIKKLVSSLKTKSLPSYKYQRPKGSFLTKEERERTEMSIAGLSDLVNNGYKLKTGKEPPK